MISWDTEGNLVLTPRAFAEGQDAKHIKLPLERGYVCPNCSTMIYGVFSTRQDKTRLVSLNTYAVGNETVSVRPDYKSELVVLGNAKYQHFYDLNHFGEDKLLARVNEASAYRCKFVKFFYEPSIPRLFHRFAKDMSGMELYGIGAAGVYYRDHAELLEACQKVIGGNMDRMRAFLAVHPYGRFVPDHAGKGPAAYVVMYRFEQQVLRNFYKEVIERTHECVHAS